MEKNLTDLLTLMKLLLTVLQYKLPFLLDAVLKIYKMFYFWMLLLYLWELKLLVQLWLSLFLEIPLFPLKNPKYSLLMLITNLESWFKFSKVNVNSLKTTIFLVNSTWKVLLLHPEVSHKSKYPLTLMKTVFWTSLLPIKLPLKLIKLPSLTTKVDYLNKILIDSLRKLNYIKHKMNVWKRKLKVKTASKTTLTQSETH